MRRGKSSKTAGVDSAQARHSDPAMNTQQGGTLAHALENGRKLLSVDPARAEEQAREILKVVPLHPMATLLLASSRRAQGDNAGARAILESVASAQPALLPAQYELGSVLGAMGDTHAAIAAFMRAAQIDQNQAAVWRALGDQYTLIGDGAKADDAYARSIKASVNDPQLVEAASALCDGRLAVAERSLRDFLKMHPTDVAAMRMLAEAGVRLGAYDDAERLLARAVELAPSFTAARHNYAVVLNRQFKSEEALEQIDLLLKREPNNTNYRALRAAILVRIGEYEKAIGSYEILLREQPSIPKAWMSYGHALKTVGRQDDGIEAYRKSIALMPSLGESYWSLANLKTFRFTPAEIDAMRAQLARSDISEEDRFHLDFALGKALEDQGAYAPSFEHYVKANTLRRESLDYSADSTSDHVRRSKAVFTRAFFAARAGTGSPARDPIFVVSLPRSGSTLIEQILSSHSAVEGTMELQDINRLVRSLGEKPRKQRPEDYPELLDGVEHERFKALGEEYLERTRVQRKSGRPHFVDKMPNNFVHLGFMHLILPNAKIIDARRHPMGCCLSNFKQHFARGQAFTYDLTDIARYYRDYAELMAHFDSVLPGRVHRVFYENMVADPEREILALLDYCGLPFEENCLRFYETDRAVRTASSEQVRRPIFTEGVEQWRNYERWLGPLREALGPIVDTYPEVPVF